MSHPRKILQCLAEGNLNGLSVNFHQRCCGLQAIEKKFREEAEAEAGIIEKEVEDLVVDSEVRSFFSSPRRALNA